MRLNLVSLLVLGIVSIVLTVEGHEGLLSWSITTCLSSCSDLSAASPSSVSSLSCCVLTMSMAGVRVLLIKAAKLVFVPRRTPTPPIEAEKRIYSHLRRKILYSCRLNRFLSLSALLHDLGCEVEVQMIPASP